MTIIRLLALFLVFWLIYRIIRIKMDKRQITPKKQSKIVDIKKCSYCDVHIPEKDAVQANGQFYCCSEHLSLGNKKG